MNTPKTEFSQIYAIVKWHNMQRHVIEETAFKNPVQARKWFDQYVIKNIILPNDLMAFYFEDGMEDVVYDDHYIEALEKLVNIDREQANIKYGAIIYDTSYKIKHPRRILQYEGPGVYTISMQEIKAGKDTFIIPTYLEGKGMMIYRPPQTPGIMYALEVIGGEKIAQQMLLN